MITINIIRDKGKTCDSDCHYFNSVRFNKQLNISKNLFFSYYNLTLLISIEFNNDKIVYYEPRYEKVLKTIGIENNKNSEFIKYNSAEFKYILKEFREFNKIINKAKNGANMDELYNIWRNEYL